MTYQEAKRLANDEQCTDWRTMFKAAEYLNRQLVKTDEDRLHARALALRAGITQTRFAIN